MVESKPTSPDENLYDEDFARSEIVRRLAKKYELYPIPAIITKSYRKEVAKALLLETGKSDVAARIILGVDLDERKHAKLSEDLFEFYGFTKKKRFQEEGDSHYGMRYSDYAQILKGIHFQKNPKEIDVDGKGKTVEFWSRSEDGLLVIVDRFNEGLIFSALKYELHVPTNLEEMEQVDRLMLDDILEGAGKTFVKWTNAPGGAYCVTKTALEGIADYVRRLTNWGWRTNPMWHCHDFHFKTEKDKELVPQMPFTISEMVGYKRE